MKKILSLVIIILALSCTEETSNFTLKGNIKGLKKGTLYLEREQDSIYNVIDSLVINGNPEFELHCNLEEPEVLYLRLNKNDNKEGIIAFFADKGVTEINSTLKNFNLNAKISGSKQQEILQEYLLVMSKFNDQNLELIKERFDPKNTNDSLNAIDYQNKQKSLVKRQYLYTINFAITHDTSEVAPYLAVKEIPDASTKFLDTIYNSLTNNIKSSLYGKKLKELIDERKDN